MAKKMGTRTTIALVAAIAILIYLSKRGQAGAIQLRTGWNEVTYTGKTQLAGVAMQSIRPYIAMAYYFDHFDELDPWKPILYDSTVLWSGMGINIKVTQDCTWTF